MAVDVFSNQNIFSEFIFWIADSPVNCNDTHKTYNLLHCW